jgi:hypothetical protein
MFGRKIATTLLRSAGSSSSRVAVKFAKPMSTFVTGRSSIINVNDKAMSSKFRSFSSESNAESNAESSLSQILSEEILGETSRKDEDVDEDYDDVKKYISSIFQINQKTGYGEVTLTRSFKGEEITVKFDCQDEADSNDEQEQGEEENFENQDQEHTVGEEDAENMDKKFGIHFEVMLFMC